MTLTPPARLFKFISARRNIYNYIHILRMSEGAVLAALRLLISAFNYYLITSKVYHMFLLMSCSSRRTKHICQFVENKNYFINPLGGEIRFDMLLTCNGLIKQIKNAAEDSLLDTLHLGTYVS